MPTCVLLESMSQFSILFDDVSSTFFQLMFLHEILVQGVDIKQLRICQGLQDGFQIITIHARSRGGFKETTNQRPHLRIDGIVETTCGFGLT